MRHYIKSIVLIITIIFITQATAWAKETSFLISLNKNRTRPGKQVELTLFFFETSVSYPKMPFIDGLDLIYKSSANVHVTIDGKTRDAMAHTYKIVPLKLGAFKIGPLSFKYDNDTYISNQIVLEVTKEAAIQTGETSASVQEEQSLSKRIYCALEIPKAELFVNEKGIISFKLYSDWLDVEDIKLLDPPSTSIIKGKFSKGKYKTIQRDGMYYAVMEWDNWFYAPETGEFTIEPVKIKFDIAKRKKGDNASLPPLLNTNEDFYNKLLGSSRIYPVEFSTEPVKVRIMPLPSKGRPSGFKGAVGNFNVNINIDRTDIKAGDIINLTTEITGNGNYNTVHIPVMQDTEGIEVYGPKVTREENKIIYVQAVKIYSTSIKEIPKMTFDFFNPESKEYSSIVKGHILIKVEEGETISTVQKESGAFGFPKPVKGKIDIIGIKDSPGMLQREGPTFYKSKNFISLQLFPLFILALTLIIQRRVDMLRYDRWLRASIKARSGIKKTESYLKANNIGGFYEAVFKTIQEYFAEIFYISAGGITRKNIIDSIENRISRKDIVDKIKNIFEDCYLVKYAMIEAAGQDMKNTLNNFKDVIEYLNSNRPI